MLASSQRFAFLRFIVFFTFVIVFSTAARAQADGELKIAELGQCKLESGQVIEHCRVGYRTWGKLNAEGTNGVLFPTWYDGRSGDLAGFFGADRLVDTSKFFGVALDALGDGVSSSPSNSNEQHGPAFPAFTIRDMVNAEYRVATEVLHMKHAHAVVGISMGGFQTFEWAASYPDFVDVAVPIVGSPKLTVRDLLLCQLLKDAIELDPGYKEGSYTEQPSLTMANELIALNLTSPSQVIRAIPLEKSAEWLGSMRHPGRQDANDRLWQLKALAGHDVLRGRNMQAATTETKPRFFIVAGAQDHMVNPGPAMGWANADGALTFISQGDCGHQVFDCDAQSITTAIRAFLAAPASN